MHHLSTCLRIKHSATLQATRYYNKSKNIDQADPHDTTDEEYRIHPDHPAATPSHQPPSHKHAVTSSQILTTTTFINISCP